MNKLKQLWAQLLAPWTWNEDLRRRLAERERVELILLDRIRRLEVTLRDRTELAVDLSPGARDRSWCIMVGQHKGSDYVQAFELRSDRTFADLVEQLKYMERMAELRRVDAPPEFRAVVKREVFRG